ncbi:Glycine dehydrogenase (decarboxylating) [Elusimicrobium minutum Pei191]|uniref:Probable glycine dehydrogenase (decarboxylating) subunit 1 n=1 Tax=Elusimicrobium minutum (strain Pei191) TaxID=445932 RepID=B2KEF6_ELUMP|nr:aminomethyl-transferring glycine dehydrogenase subunit GcvPA [Elusimicrobium minutum]ACC98902.1 Glycine dehydrogenase (decarboxylating) [Elusimicrobium minutum Pei191]
MFVSNSEEQKQEMLSFLGYKNIEELIKDAAPGIGKADFDLPAALSELELQKHIGQLASKNKKALNFIGAGAYEHFTPAAVNAISSRGEFLTAYTPYQAEASQGTLQAIYEYQSSICALFDMDISNASHYDGATALAEAVGAAVKIKNKNTVLIPAALHPHYKQTLKTYFKYADIKFIEVSCEEGSTDIEDLKEQLENTNVAAFVLANPNFFGVVEEVDEISEVVKEAGALLIACVNPLSLGVLKTPGSYDADFAVGDGQVLGNSVYFGGPHLGIFTCKKEYVRSLPGRVVGIAKDKDGNRAFVLTLQAREQHIRRERSASNICSNQALCALNAVVYMTLLGPEGMVKVASLNLEKSHKLKDLLSKEGCKLKFKQPFFNEFVIECPKPAEEICKELANQGIAAGYPLKEFGGGFENALLVCATETKTDEEIKKFAQIMGGF